MCRLPHNSSTLPLPRPLKPACQVTGEGPSEPTAVSTWKVQFLPNPPAQAGSIPSSLQEHSDNPQEQRVPLSKLKAQPLPGHIHLLELLCSHLHGPQPWVGGRQLSQNTCQVKGRSVPSGLFPTHQPPWTCAIFLRTGFGKNTQSQTSGSGL